MVYAPEILGQHCSCGKLWLQQHRGSEQGRNQIWVLIADCIYEGGEAGKRNISLTVLLVWKLNAFWELKLDVIFLSPVKEYGVQDLPLQSGDSARIFILNLVVAKLF